jgi:hypothetical protein
MTDLRYPDSVNIISPSASFSTAPTAPTATPGTNDTTVANTAFVQAALAAITKGLTIVQTSATTLSPTTGNYYLATGTTTVNLPAGNNGDVIGIADGSSNFGTANCTINPNGAQTIAGETSIRLTADNAYVVLAFWGTRWTIIHGNSFVQPDTNLATNILTSGSGTYTPNIAANWLKIRIWGATGGGGGADGQDIGTVAIGGAGGVAGYLEKTILISTGETFTYSVGAAGVGGAAGNNNGTAGGTTSFTGSISGTAQVTGSGGGSGKLGTSSGNSGNSGTGGVATGGDLNQNGARLVAIRWNGGVQFGYSNNVCAFGGDFVTATDSPGVNSTGVGVPGSGGQSIDTIANNAGGNGFSGRIIIEEYI